MMGTGSQQERRENARRFRISLGIAILLHALILAVGNWGLATQAEFGMAGAVGESVKAIRSEPPPLTVDLEDFVPAETVSKVRSRPSIQSEPSTSHSGGALEIPAYYRNPPPPYPEEARFLKQEGTVLLSVGLDSLGRPVSVLVRKSSGFPLLDESAVQTVKSWRFKPARLAGIAVSTDVEIPVRFLLVDAQP